MRQKVKEQEDVFFGTIYPYPFNLSASNPTVVKLNPG